MNINKMRIFPLRFSAFPLVLAPLLALFCLPSANLPAQNPEKPSLVEMVFVQRGSFQMGSDYGDQDEKPPHFVSLSSFFIGKYEITQEQYWKVMGKSPSEFSFGGEASRRPVDQVSWLDAIRFCNKLSEIEGLEAAYTISGKDVFLSFFSKGYRLPSEAEWEFAARGGASSQGFKYSGSNDPVLIGWHDTDFNSKTHAAGTKAPNELGIFDMSGNVWEWCWDWFGDYVKGRSTDPTGADSGRYRVYRGGGWNSGPKSLRSTNRDYDTPNTKKNNIGFRVARRP